VKFNIISVTHLSRKQKAKVLAKWSLYSLSLLVVFMLMTSGALGDWQPFTMIPLAVAVAMREGELNSSVFAAVCGLFLDIATGNIFGFSALLLLPSAMGTALIARNLIKVNLFNHLWLTTLVCAVMCFIEFFFEYMIWDYDGYAIIFKQFYLPSYVSTIIVAPVFFILIKYIFDAMPAKEAAVDNSESDEKEEGV